MRTRDLAVLSSFLLAAACAHTTRTGGDDQSRSSESAEGAGGQARAKKVTPKTPPGHPPLAASPGELMRPEAREKIARALQSKGFLEQGETKGTDLSASIRKFQGSQGLAETGFPDHETLMRLGVDPKEVDKSLENLSGSQPGEAQADVGKRK